MRKSVARQRAARLFKGAKEFHAKPAASMWALRSDGAFLLIGTELEIPAPAARALVELVRKGDGVKDLVAFIERLDKGQA